MRKILSVLVVFTVLFSAAAFAADDSVPPLQEYSINAWPITAEGYADLLNNTDARYGQVYVVKGVVHEVLSQEPLRIIIFTGEDGNSQPVVVEYPEQPGFKWEEGNCYRIYADVSSILDSMPVLTARYTLITQSADLTDEAAAPDGD